MRKFLFALLAVSMILFSCQSEPEQKVVEKPPVEEPKPQPEPEPEVVEVTPENKGVFVINCPPDMKEVDLVMRSKLLAVAEAIKETKPELIEVVGHSAKLNTPREEELAAAKSVKLIVDYLEDIEALRGVDVVEVENKAADDPAASHNDIDARGENRRVVITLK